MALSYVDMYFQRFYHIGEVLDRVWRAMDQRKLHYASVVAFLQYNRPIKFATDAEEFLFHCFSSDGQFTRETAAWMLWKYGVLRPGDGVSPSQIEKDLFPPLAPEALDEVRFRCFVNICLSLLDSPKPRLDYERRNGRQLLIAQLSRARRGLV